MRDRSRARWLDLCTLVLPVGFGLFANNNVCKLIGGVCVCVLAFEAISRYLLL